MKRIAVAAAIAVVAAGCSSAQQTDASWPRPAGPLAHLRWPARSVHVGEILVDDGRVLWALSLDGSRHRVWRHPHIVGWIAAAAPDGRELAYVVYTNARKRPILYLLEHSGHIRTVDVGGDSIHSVAFLRSPGRPRGTIHLYWIRSDPHGELSFSRLRVLTSRGSRDVNLRLRDGEHPYLLSGYPGSSNFAVTTAGVFGQVDTLVTVPETDADAAGTRIGALMPAHLFDLREAPAWISRYEFVAHTSAGVQLYDVGCSGSRLLAPARAVDDGLLNEGDWPFLALGRRVTVIPRLPAATEGAAMALGEHPQHVALLDVRSGRIARTGLTFLARRGSSWVAVQPARSRGTQPLCNGLSHAATP